MSLGEVVQLHGWTKEEYARTVTWDSHWGGDLELTLLPLIVKKRLPVFHEEEENWCEYLEYGCEGQCPGFRSIQDGRFMTSFCFQV